MTIEDRKRGRPRAYPDPEVGTTFGLLTVVEVGQHYAGRKGRSGPAVRLQCACGDLVTRLVRELVRGAHRTCGDYERHPRGVARGAE